MSVSIANERLKVTLNHLKQSQLTMAATSQTSVPPLTTHVLDTARGLPAPNLPMVLSRQSGNAQYTVLENGMTNSDGRGSFLKNSQWQVGTYRLHFDTETYFRDQHTEGFYPYVEVVFTIKDPTQHYHVPLLLSPYGYSTYRGS